MNYILIINLFEDIMNIDTIFYKFYQSYSNPKFRIVFF